MSSTLVPSKLVAGIRSHLLNYLIYNTIFLGVKGGGVEILSLELKVFMLHLGIINFINRIVIREY